MTVITLVCLTIAPAFFTAAIYITLGQWYVQILALFHTVILVQPLMIPSVIALGSPRLNPKLYAYIFIPSDIIALALQGSGGGLSAGHSHQTGVDLSLAGLSFQVASLTVFSVLALDWIRHWRSCRSINDPIVLPGRFKAFAWLLVLAVMLILARCAYRIDELSSGYDGSIFHDQASFIVLEGV